MKTLRWNRIFDRDGRALVVALDHIPSGFMQGWEYPEATLDKIFSGKPDAIMCNYGVLKRFASLFPREVGTILRVDSGPTYLVEEWPHYTDWRSFYSLRDALLLGVDGVIASIFFGGPVEIDSRQIAVRIARSSDRWGIPCGLEALASGPKISDPFDPELVSFVSRAAAEFGADYVKTHYTGDPASFKRVVERCPVPVLIAGGPKTASDVLFLEQVAGMLDVGGQGVFVGRNVWQHSNPTGMVRALKEIIHGGSSVQQALSQLG